MFTAQSYTRIVLKIGSSLLVDDRGRLNQPWLRSLAADIADLCGQGKELVVVSSGAIALGRSGLGLPSSGNRLHEKQAAAGVGQIQLSAGWQNALEEVGLVTAQILLTSDDTEHRRRYLNAHDTMITLISRRAVPVVNENDTVATDEIRYGDNDRLAARVAQMISADALILFSDVDGLYDRSPAIPGAVHVETVSAITPEIEAMPGAVGSMHGTGGMATKLMAARIATAAGCDMFIADGRELHPLKRLVAGALCTRFTATDSAVFARKRWIAGSLRVAGRLRLDIGAVMALRDGKSLLPVGVTAVDGDFRRGDTVALVDTDEKEIARGLSAYDGEEARKIIGRKSSEIAGVLGYSGRNVLVHHNDLAWTGTGTSKEPRVQTKNKESLGDLMQAMGRRAREAVSRLAVSSTGERNGALMAAADAIRMGSETILDANRSDMERARARGLSDAMLDRLMLDAVRVENIAQGLESVAALDDPLGEVIAEWDRPNGLRIQRVRVPLGVIGIIYESRPNVTADAGALCLKSGNAAILRGGSESHSSSQAIHRCLTAGLAAVSLPGAAVQLVPTQDREAVGHLLRGLSGNVDVVVPRGGKGLIQRVQKDARVPVIGHLEGICHVYVHESSNPEMALAVTVNAKMRRTGICGAAETLLIDAAAAATLLPDITETLIQLGCELRGDPRACAIDPRMQSASAQDWSTEYLDAILSVKVVDHVGAAIEHILRYGSGHTEAIVAEDPAAVERFFRELDSAILLHNASTQFADGGEFGMGAEIGIATGRIHARGPVGAAELTSYKYLVRGSGQVRPA